MPRLGSLERSTSCQFVSAIGSRPFLPFLYPSISNQTSSAVPTRRSYRPCRSCGVDECFVNALVAAGSCGDHLAPKPLNNARGLLSSETTDSKLVQRYRPSQYRRFYSTAQAQAVGSSNRPPQIVTSHLEQTRSPSSRLPTSSRRESGKYTGNYSIYDERPVIVRPLQRHGLFPRAPISKEVENSAENERKSGLRTVSARSRPENTPQKSEQEPQVPVVSSLLWTKGSQDALEYIKDVKPNQDEKDTNGSFPSPPIRYLPVGQPSREYKHPKSSDEAAAIDTLISKVNDPEATNESIFQAYTQLPSIGVSYLPDPILRELLKKLSTPKRKRKPDLMRYMTLVDDMQQAGIPLNQAEWSSAIYLVGRSSYFITDVQVDKAQQVWQRMEKDAGVKSTTVTFNILFDIASKAGKFSLAESILEEMRKRGLGLNRFGRVGLIHHYGGRRDAEGVRKAYRSFIESGEVVDTAVLNCLISSLLQAKEPAAAEEIYERMKSIHFRTLEKPLEGVAREYPINAQDHISNRKASRDFARVIKSCRLLKESNPEEHWQIQNSLPLSPDLSTFYQLIRYHALETANLNRITVLLNEMHHLFQIPLQGQIFILLFKGFALHSGHPGTTWTRTRLERAWNTFLRAALDPVDVRLSRQQNRRDERQASKESGQRSADDSSPAELQDNDSETSAWTKNAQSRPKSVSPKPPKRLSLAAETFDESIFPESSNYVDPYFDRDENDGPVYLGTSMFMWALRAYARCANRKRVEEIYFQIEWLWGQRKQRDPREMSKVTDELRRALKEVDRRSKWSERHAAKHQSPSH